MAFCALAVWNIACASDITALGCQPEDTWVSKQVDELVLAARAAYESEKAFPAYEKALDQITETIRQRRLSQDEEFLSRYRQFIEYIDTASLAQKEDHQLGFCVTGLFRIETAE